MKLLQDMTESELLRAEKKADAATSAAGDVLIAEGYGDVVWSELCKLAKEETAPEFVKKYVALREASGKFVTERQYRMNYHGSLKRVIVKHY